jgi:hypothetical protein
MNQQQTQEVQRLKGYFPYRICYGALNQQTGEFVSGAVATMRQPNKLAKEGWTVWVVGK